MEAKLGVFVDKGTGQRVATGGPSPAVLGAGGWYRFESSLHPSMHAHFNRALNTKIGPDRRWSYKHTRTVDSILSGSLQKLRVTRDAATTRILECMRKSRLGDLAISIPGSPVDVRISVNMEHPLPADDPAVAGSQAAVDTERHKDRRSYTDTHSAIRYDLTEVKQARGPQQTAELKYELELESVDVAGLREDPSLFLHELCGFLSLLQ